MKYAKIKDNVIVKYPYEFSDLLIDNPYTTYDSRYELLGWFNQTDDAIKENYSLQEVKELPIPEFDEITQKVHQMSEPMLTQGEWVLSWVVEDKTEEEIEQARAHALFHSLH